MSTRHARKLEYSDWLPVGTPSSYIEICGVDNQYAPVIKRILTLIGVYIQKILKQMEEHGELKTPVDSAQIGGVRSEVLRSSVFFCAFGG